MRKKQLKSNFFTIVALTLTLSSGLLCQASEGLELAPERMDEGDLEVRFADRARPGGFLSREALLALPVEERELYIPYVDAHFSATILPLSELLSALGKDAESSVLSYSYDGYVSFYPPEFTAEYAPFILLELEGFASGDLNLEGGPDLGPYYITFAGEIEKGSEVYPDPDNKRPFGVNQITIGAYDHLMAPLYSGRFADLTPIQQSGRHLWIHNCMSCHAWTEGGVGGDLSNRTAEFISIHARHNRRYFYDMVRDPAKLISDVKMPNHHHYEDAQIEAIRLFLRQFPR
ncbi:MAG: cytochrome c [Puniceicoccaceae bacterium]|nr:MAG: cytochrome c [Puniceicoccaceae bacterium]